MEPAITLAKTVALSPITATIVLLSGLGIRFLGPSGDQYVFISTLWLSIGGAASLVHIFCQARAHWKHRCRIRLEQARIREASKPRGPLIAALTPGEVSLLNRFFRSLSPEPNTVALDAYDPVVESLERKGFIERIGLETSSGSLDQPFRVRVWVYDEPWRSVFAKRVNDEFGHVLGGRPIGGTAKAIEEQL